MGTLKSYVENKKRLNEKEGKLFAVFWPEFISGLPNQGVFCFVS